MVREDDVSVKFERALALLDMWTVVERDSAISMKVFRKETHTDQYLHVGSNHLMVHKRGVAKYLMNRVDRLVSGEIELRKEREHIRKA